jgi:hypothetical protein
MSFDFMANAQYPIATSYINEHTAEYYLVPAMSKVLEMDFRYVAPIFPWFSREFSKLSRSLHGSHSFQILVMFPRRPKLAAEDRHTIYATINLELIDFCEIGKKYGVPVLAGCPEAVDLWDLALSKKVIWLDMVHLRVTTYLSPIANIDARIFENDIRALARSSPSMDMREFEVFVREARASQPRRMYGPQYKPVYFLLKDARQR